MNNIHIAATLSPKEPNAKGEVSIRIRITVARRRYYKSTGIMARPDDFTEKDLIKPAVANAAYKNGKIKDQMRDIERSLLKIEGVPSETQIRAILKGLAPSDDMPSISIAALCRAVQREYEGVLSTLTLTGFKSCVTKFVDYAKRDIPIELITPAFLTKYEGYARKTLSQADTTTWSDLKELRSIFNKGIKLGIISHYPFKQYSVPKYVQPLRNYLTQGQITALEEYADNEKKPGALRKSAAWLIFSCYSGLRYSDMASFDHKKWVKGGKLYFSDAKEKTPHFVPIYPRLQKAIDRLESFYPIQKNAVFNRFLKELMELCDIEIKLTVHVGRHTFAVTYLDNGGSKEVLQRLMGHKRMSTTEIYGQITDRRIIGEVGKIMGG